MRYSNEYVVEILASIASAIDSLFALLEKR